METDDDFAAQVNAGMEQQQVLLSQKGGAAIGVDAFNDENRYVEYEEMQSYQPEFGLDVE